MHRVLKSNCVHIEALSRALCLRGLGTAGVNVEMDTEPPLRKHRTATSLLEAISKTAGITNHGQMTRDIDTIPENVYDYLTSMQSRMKGKEAARFVVNADPNLFANFNFEQPPISAFRPRIPATAVGSPSDKALNTLISLAEVDKAWDMYQQLNKADPDTIEASTRLRLLDLLAFTNGRPTDILTTDSLHILLSRTDDLSTRHPHQQEFSLKDTWDAEGRAEQLFASLPEEDRGPGYRAMIRGMVRHNAYEKALSTHIEMRDKGFVGDLASYNAALRCVHTIEYEMMEYKEGDEVVKRPRWMWNFARGIMWDMRSNSIDPDVETFNSLIFSLSETIRNGRVRPPTALNCLQSTLKEMELLDILPNIGTLTNVTRMFRYLDEGIEQAAIQEMTIKRHLERDYFKCIRYVLECVNLDVGKKRFGTINDVPVLFLMVRNKRRKQSQLRSAAMNLFSDSPNLIVSVNSCRIFLQAMIKDAQDRELITLFEKNNNIFFSLSMYFVWKVVRAFCVHQPDNVEKLFNHSLVYNCSNRALLGTEDSWASGRELLLMMAFASKEYPATRLSVLRSLDVFWSKACSVQKPIRNPKRHMYLMMAICMPEDPSLQEITSPLFRPGTEMAWKIVSTILDDGSAVNLAALHKILQLGGNLLELGRTEDALVCLKLALGNQGEVDKVCASESNFVIDKLLNDEKYRTVLENAAPDLVSRLEEHREGSQPIFRIDESASLRLWAIPNPYDQESDEAFKVKKQKSPKSNRVVRRK